MKLQIKYVKDNGIIESERVILKSTGDINVGTYIVSDTTYYTNDEISNELRHMFWIPDKEVAQGDLIVIYTKDGKNKSVKNDSGNSTHFFYWGLGKSIWNKSGDAAVLFSLADWAYKQA